MKYRKIAAGALAAALCLCPNSLSCLAGSPEFAYTEEKWESLRDDKLEFEEIGDLVHEYNNTVLRNQIEYEDYRGKDKDEIARDYYDAADEIYGSLYYPSAGDENYAGSLSSYLNGRLQADSLKEQGDDNVEDAEILKLEYDKEEAQLVKEAQELMITYWTDYKNLTSLEKAREQAQADYSSTVTKLRAGMSTQADLLLAQESVTSAEASLLSTEAGLNNTKEKLCLMLGWTYGAEVEIGEAPAGDFQVIEAIDLEGDVERGLSSNYSLKILEKKIANAKSGSNREALEEQYKSQKETAASQIKAAYRTLLLAKSDYDQAQNACALEIDALNRAASQLAAGTITQKDYTRQEASCTTAEITVETAQLQLLSAALDYQWSVEGLAPVS